MTRRMDEMRSVDLNDRERILMTIIDELAGTQIMTSRAWSSDAFKSEITGGGYRAHFAYWDEPKAGDLVLARTGRASRWKVGFYVESRPHCGAVIREIGTDVLCNYDNESFIPIRGLTESELWEGDRRAFYIKVLKAFRMGDSHMHLYGGLRFDGNTALVTVRERWGGMGEESHPYEIRMSWSKRTAIKTILAALVAGGYGTRSFRKPD